MAGKAYIISNYKVSQSTYDFIWQKTRTLTPEQRRFFNHVLASHLLDLRRQRYEHLPGYDVLGVKIPSRTIKAEFERGFSWERDGKALRPLLEASDYAKGECRYFQVVPSVLSEILEQLHREVEAPDGAPAVNLFDGLAYNVTLAVTEEGATTSSKLMRDAVRVLHTVSCPINVNAVQAHLHRLREEGKVLRLQNDKLCAQTMFAGMKPSAGIGRYTPSYSAQSSGRIGELGGGVQSCSRAMKAGAFSGVEQVHNYDLRSSQGYALLQELKLADLDSTWLEAHLGPGAFEERAGQLGLSKATYKICFFSTIMGATHVWLEGEHVGAVQQALLDHEPDEDRARRKFAAVVAQLRPLRAIVGKWTAWLLDGPSCPHRRTTQRREFLENAAGQKLLLDRSRPQNELKREAAAHLLQGQEAAYIHHLTILSPEFSFTPVSNQHDGLVTVGEVPAAAQQRAAELSGFAYAFLEEKPFL